MKEDWRNEIKLLEKEYNSKVLKLKANPKS